MSDNFRWPLRDNRIRRGLVNHTFGPEVRKDANGNAKCHQGWDLEATEGTECYAIGKGKVVVVTPNHPDWGNIVVIELDDVKVDGNKIYAAYAHLNAINVTQGAAVKMGDTIGETGSTGNASGLKEEDHHLHFELRTQAQPGLGVQGRVNPEKLYGSPPLTVAKSNNDKI